MKLCIPLGRIVATPAALTELEKNNQAAWEFIERHANGNWGDALGEDDRAANNEAVRVGGRLLSAYYLRNGETLWIITEWDRSVTTVLLPEDY